MKPARKRKPTKKTPPRDRTGLVHVSLSPEALTKLRSIRLRSRSAFVIAAILAAPEPCVWCGSIEGTEVTSEGAYPSCKVCKGV